MSQLPTGITNSNTLSVRMWPGHVGGPLHLLGMDLDDADDIGETIVYWGGVIATEAYDAQFYIDWQSEHAYAVYDALFAAANLGTDMMNYPVYWCAGVEDGDVFGDCGFVSDGLIPTSRQTFSGASNTTLNPGPSHTTELYTPAVIGFVGSKLCEISPYSCSS